jgi:type I restriction enzyme S subunit
MNDVKTDNAALILDKSNWAPTKLGDLADSISERVSNPENSEHDRFVGLEHFVSGELKVRKWASTENLSSSAKAFKAGDILFARRNAYLRRASMVDFDGCCSGDAFVLREKKEKVIPGFLAFVVNSDSLWEFANQNAAGTMSKRVKWRDLANYEFLLPPKDQQAKLAELLWAADEVVEREREVLERLSKSKKAIFYESIFSFSENRDKYFGKSKSLFDVKKLGNLIVELQYGISESLNGKGEIPVLRMNNLQNGKLSIEDLKYYNPVDGELDRFILDKGDILFNRTNSYELVGKASIFNIDGVFSFASYLIRIKTNKEFLDSSFLNLYFNSSIGLSKIRKYRTPGVSQSNINAQNIKNIPIPLPPIDLQKRILEKIISIEENENLIESKITSSQALQKSLINQIF